MNEKRICKAIVTRDVGPDEVEWLKRTYKQGETLYEFIGPTYGCIDQTKGTALSEAPGEPPCFEFPHDAFRWAE